jgi:ubiquinone biosynthesis protein
MSDAPVNVLVLVGGAVGGAGVVAAQAVAARRLLGLRVGAARTIVAGAVGWIMFGLISPRLDDPVEWWPLLSLLLGVPILATMGLLAVGEALLPSGGRTLRELRRRLARARRYLEITVIAVRHGLRPYLRGRGAGAGDASVARSQLSRSLRTALEDGGVTFVKLGQMLSTRADLLPGESIEELSRLQEQVAPIPWPDVEAVLEAELGPLQQTFASLDREPLAAASIAQVHAARLRSGEEVVVKVQRPGIAPVVERDLDVVLRLAATMEARRRRGLSVHATIDGVDGAGLNVVELARGFATALREELDFRIEAQNVAAVSAALEERGGDPLVHVPAVHEALSSRRVLVMERLRGVPFSAAEATIRARGLDRHGLAVGLLNALLSQIMRDGVFHADPHPGNVLLLDDGRLGLLDFGSVGRLDPIVQGALARLLIGVERRDPAGLRDALLELAGQPDDVDERRLVRDLGRFVARHLSPGKRPDAAMYVDLFTAVAAAGLAVPPDAAAVFRTLATLEGTLTQLDPGFDIVAESRTFASAHLASSLPRAVGEELSALLPVIGRLPRRLDRITGTLEQGRLSLNVRLLADERDRRVITTLVHQALLAFVAAAIGLMSVLLLAAHGSPAVTPSVTLYQLLGYNLLLVSLLLVLRVLFVVFRPERPR